MQPAKITAWAVMHAGRTKRYLIVLAFFPAAVAPRAGMTAAFRTERSRPGCPDRRVASNGLPARRL
jgi:hypothetical protein